MRVWFAIAVCTSMVVGEDLSLPTANHGKERRSMRIIVKYLHGVSQGDIDAQPGGVTG